MKIDITPREGTAFVTLITIHAMLTRHPAPDTEPCEPTTVGWYARRVAINFAWMWVCNRSTVSVRSVLCEFVYIDLGVAILVDMIRRKNTALGTLGVCALMSLVRKWTEPDV